MTTETKKFNFFAIGTAVTLLVYLAGAAYALGSGAINFQEFIAAVGTPLGAMTGWAAKSTTTA